MQAPTRLSDEPLTYDAVRPSSGDRGLLPKPTAREIAEIAMSTLSLSLALADVPTAPQTVELPPIEADAWNRHFETRSPQDLLAWAIERWRDRLVLVTSFQATGLVLLHMAWQIDPKVRVATLDTGRLPQETHGLMETVRRRFNIDIEVLSPDPNDLQPLVREHGPNLFYESPELRRACCHVRKVEPLRRALAGADAWITGLRRDQAATRSAVDKVAFDGGPELVKLSPLADWSEVQVESYTLKHNLPRHPLYAKGYRSIGCAPCTRAVAQGADPRSGRWWWENNTAKECGLHLRVLPS